MRRRSDGRSAPRQGAGHAADATQGKEEADDSGPTHDLADQEHDLDRGGDAAEQVGGGRGGRDRSEQGIAEDEAETFAMP